MAVVIVEEIEESVRAHVEFPGRYLSSRTTYAMDFVGNGSHEVARFYRNPDYLENHSLAVNARLLARVLRRLAYRYSVSEPLGEHGRFTTLDGAITFVTACGERHFFELEDLLILADIIEDRAVVTQIA